MKIWAQYGQYKVLNTIKRYKRYEDLNTIRRICGFKHNQEDMRI